MFNAKELSDATNGEFLNSASADFSVDGIVTDTRLSSDGKLFLALKGERFDAHDFLQKALDGHCRALCIRQDAVSKLPPHITIPVLLVDDTLKAYQNLALAYRQRFHPTCAAITGSVGKTSVKEMLRAIFLAAAEESEVVCTEGNTNNQVGVPQNLFRFSAKTRFAALEAGTNHHGEIAPLSRMIAPHGAIINSIAPCHLEFLGSLDGVAEEKSHIFDFLDKDGYAVIPEESPANAILRKHAAPFRILTFGNNEHASVRATYLGGTLSGSRFQLTFPDKRTFELEWSLSGSHQALNAAGAAAVGLALGIPEEVIVRGLPGTKLPGMRVKTTVLNAVTYVNDAYNANPSSMKASLQWLSEFADPEKLILVLGEMRELGEHSETEHRAVLALAKELFPHARIFVIGKAFHGYENSEAAAADIAAAVKPGDLVFAKGSRGTAVENALPREAR